MIRRSFLRFLALAPFAALAAPQSARGQIVARAAGPAGAPGLSPDRVDLLLRMGRIHGLRRMIDACDRELDAIRAKHEFKPAAGGPTLSAAWFAEADPVYRRATELEELLTKLERAPLDTLTASPQVAS